MSFLKATQGLLKTVNAVFGTEAIYTQTDGAIVTTIKGVFDHVYFEAGDFAGRQSVLKITLADLPAEPEVDDTVQIGSQNFTVLHHEPDAHGSTILILRKT